MTLTDFLQKITHKEEVSFAETMSIIASYYDYQPAEFSNGLGEHKLINEAGSNEGSCKIFAFAKIHQLTATQTLNLFGDFYRKDVLENAAGNNHQNIRNFIQFGWDGITLAQPVLTRNS